MHPRARTLTLPPGLTLIKVAEEVADGQQAGGGALQQRGRPQRSHLDGCGRGRRPGRGSGEGAGRPAQLPAACSLLPSPAQGPLQAAHRPAPHTAVDAPADAPADPPAKPWPSALCAASIDLRKTDMRLRAGVRGVGDRASASVSRRAGRCGACGRRAAGETQTHAAGRQGLCMCMRVGRHVRQAVGGSIGAARGQAGPHLSHTRSLSYS